VWNQEFDFQVGSLQDELRLKVMDEDVGTDDVVGMANLKLSSLCINNGVREWFTLEWKSK